VVIRFLIGGKAILRQLGMLKILVGFGLLIAALGCVIAAYGIFSMPAQQPASGNADAAGTATRNERQDAEITRKTTIGPFWQWLNAREGAISAISTLFLMVFTAALVFTTILLYLSGEHSVIATRKVAEAAKQSADVAIIAQRPWISVKAEIGPRGLFFDVNGANLDLIFFLKNTGNTPAITVWVEGGPRIDVKTNDRMIVLDQICTDAKRRAPNPKMVGYTIFPGETLPMHSIYTFANKQSIDEITAAQHGFVLPIVIGCVDYFLTFGEPTHHQSRFVYSVDYLNPQGAVLAIRPADGDKAANTLNLSPWFEAGSFQAD
jgi:hypothetical protein